MSKESHQWNLMGGTGSSAPSLWQVVCLIYCVSKRSENKNRKLKFTLTEYKAVRHYCAVGQCA